VKIQLTKPVQVGTGPLVEELTLREEVVSGDLRGVKWTALAESDHDALMRVAGRLCGQPDPVMMGLCLADTLRVVEVVSGFFSAGPETGPTR
jgi:hypothetical protein